MSSIDQVMLKYREIIRKTPMLESAFNYVTCANNRLQLGSFLVISPKLSDKLTLGRLLLSHLTKVVNFHVSSKHMHTINLFIYCSIKVMLNQTDLKSDGGVLFLGPLNIGDRITFPSAYQFLKTFDLLQLNLFSTGKIEKLDF